jgi:hypothetical protein
MATMDDLDRLALALPQTERRLGGDDDRPEYLVHGKTFCMHRSDRKDAVDEATGERLTDVLMFRVAGLDEKAHLLERRPDVCFTTPHFDGYPCVLIRIPSLALISVDELDDLVVEAWLTRAYKRVAKAWLAEQE